MQRIHKENLNDPEWEEDVPINAPTDKETFGWDDVSVYL